ncbi:capsular biosynthesis protein [Neorhizobium lilium]|uniref:Capsular biosynthesis protein n=1 Tax=Neorhizobium lilium TaxID=2503024 RepID=A0A3S3RH48_9HYPH|nr:capsular biosynthesis protein [Neorhizobium lilium]RWX75752.1 capsular biosynthesis protein [Neorhizobium lilium]
MIARTFLFLQGPASPFLRLLADAIEARGPTIRKINFSVGDAVFWWPKKGDWFRNRREDWRDYLAQYISRHGVTDIVMLGDGRPQHAIAAEVGIEMGVRVHILEHGYLRPDWLTLEPDGMTAYSRFPREPDAIRALAAGRPPADSGRLFQSSFLTYALYDLAYHIPNVALGWLVHRHYRAHGPVHPAVEYAGWIGKALTLRRRRSRAQQAITGWSAFPAESRFLFPLQLPGDYQILRHAPGGDLFSIVDAVIQSFARHAAPEASLLFKVHPIDNGLSRWPQRIKAAAERCRVSARVFIADGGDTDDLIRRSAGVVVVNSTVGLTALGQGKPVIALGSAIYDVPGLSFQGSLASFWTAPQLPDPQLFEDFNRALAATTQVRGGFIGRDALRVGVRNIAERLMEEEDRLPVTLRKPRNRPVFRYERELFNLD